MKDLEIQEQAEKIANTSQFLSDFPHDKKSVNYGFIAGAKWMQEHDKWIELKNEPNEVPEMDCYFYNKTVGVVFIPKDEYVKIGLYTHYMTANLPPPQPKTK